MAGFTPFKRHANKFNYTPRYYDPAKEEREQRRAELRGERRDEIGKEYRPGQYIRTSSAARSARRGGGRKAQSGNMRMWILIALIGAILYFGSIFYTSLMDALTPTERQPMPQQSAEYEEFNPYAPITIVPNDYDPSKEE